ncbi:hypothetical protein KY290_038047 [Solanum tuberosum]|uniref:Uncharacterized protein n=1 Tax=Solanum tuberosum TaxID=4113 RepID=A0ABQ7TXB7_SOLTU|nr:hypothetical protein KY285_037385 [Solanum tuberosum]KAH0739342.1 hypothetical protein KY290_038047 [Solanum tuberosum]
MSKGGAVEALLAKLVRHLISFPEYVLAVLLPASLLATCIRESRLGFLLEWGDLWFLVHKAHLPVPIVSFNLDSVVISLDPVVVLYDELISCMESKVRMLISSLWVELLLLKMASQDEKDVVDVLFGVVADVTARLDIQANIVEVLGCLDPSIVGKPHAAPDGPIFPWVVGVDTNSLNVCLDIFRDLEGDVIEISGTVSVDIFD